MWWEIWYWKDCSWILFWKFITLGGWHAGAAFDGYGRPAHSRRNVQFVASWNAASKFAKLVGGRRRLWQGLGLERLLHLQTAQKVSFYNFTVIHLHNRCKLQETKKSARSGGGVAVEQVSADLQWFYFYAGNNLLVCWSTRGATAVKVGRCSTVLVSAPSQVPIPLRRCRRKHFESLLFNIWRAWKWCFK